MLEWIFLLFFPQNRLIVSKHKFNFIDMLLCLYRQVCLMGESSCSTNLGFEDKKNPLLSIVVV